MKKHQFILFILCLFLSFSGLVYSQETEQGQGNYFLGVFAFEKGDYEGAEKYFKKALEQTPGNALYNDYLGKTYFKQGKCNEALNYLDKASGIDHEISGLDYDLAMAHYCMNDFGKAAELFEIVVKQEPSNILASYYAGICLFKKEDYGKALTYFIEASENSPSIKANGYYYAGICHLKMDDIDKAVSKLEYARDHAETETLRESCIKWLNSIEKEKKATKPYTLYAKAGYRYDSNVLLRPDEDTVTNKSDSAFTGYFSGDYRLYKGNGFKVCLGYDHYQVIYGELNKFNLTNGIINLYSEYQKGPVSISLSYRPHFSWLDSERYINKQELRTGATYAFQDNLISRFSYSYYSINNHLDAGWDGHSNALDLKTYYLFKDNRGYIFGGIGYEDRTARHPDHEYTQLSAEAGIFTKIPLDIDFYLTGRFENIPYGNVDSGFHVKRHDRRLNGCMSLSHMLFYKWLSVVGDFDYTKRTSNISYFRYNRKITTLSLTATF
jgi:Tfp pilus assembly protein PilF